ncbi:unnamed protein product [Phytomonas sp. Hart1]|nr:unnamed protein product [Phytomonas sp. Hart1]|eukprot:CCW68786.1 unnamed protein product [Phytomonas sp. isolate Hart1]
MPGPRKGHTSSFAAAAKVIFDSARKTGAINALQRGDKPVGHHLKDIYRHSKARDASFGGVSYKVVEFLATQKASSPLRPQPSVQSFSKKVPHLDVPSIVSSVKVESSLSTPAMEPTPAAHEQTESMEETSIPTTVVSSMAQDVGHEDNIQAQESQEEENLLDVFGDIPISEDKPLFESRPTFYVPQQNVATLKTIDEVVPSHLSDKVSSSPSRTTSVFDNFSKNEKLFSKVSLSNIEAETFSVDSWEKQREAELAQFQRKKQDEADLLAAEQLEREHQSLGNRWVEKRTSITTNEPHLTGEMSILREIYFSTSIEESLKLFKNIVGLGSRSAFLIPSASIHLLSKLRCLSSFDRPKFIEQFVKLLESSKASEDVKSKLMLSVYNGQKFITIYNTLSEDSKKTLDRILVKKAMLILLRHGKWEEAIRIVDISNAYRADPTNQLDIILVKNSYSLSDQAKAEVIAFATKNITATGRMGREAKLVLASAEKGFHRRHLLQQLASSTSADEEVYAELIRRTKPENIKEVLSDMEKRGLDKNDPKVLKVVALKAMNSKDPMLVFKEIDTQIQCIGIKPMHVSVAIKAAKTFQTENVLRAAVKIAKLIPSFNPASTLRNLTPILFTLKMYSEIADLADIFGKYLPIPEALPVVVALVNDALRSLGREPLSELSSKDVNFSFPSLNKRTGNNAVSTSDETIEVDLSPITETMLIYARDKQWEKALEVLTQLPNVGARNLDALTLIYNCSLGAAVTKPDVSLSIFHSMQEKAVPMNTTTVNTILTTLGKSSEWEKSIEIFNELSMTYRDTNTYLIILSVLGKYNRWEDAISVYDQAMKAFNKPPLSIFTLTIGIASNHTWSETLRVFQELMRHHSSSVKDNVVNQVIRSLEQNGRSTEIVSLQKLLEKRKKKKT